MPPVVVGPQQRPDQQHRGAGSAHPAGKHGADRQQRRIHRRRTMQVALDVDATGDGEERQQQDDERDVVEQQQVQGLINRRRDAEHHGEGHNDQ